MAYNTYTIQGSFTSNGAGANIVLRGDVDWMEVYNMTTLAAGGAGTGVYYKWFRGMAANTSLEYIQLAADDSLSPVVNALTGFTLMDTSDDAAGALNITPTQVTGAAPPRVLAASTAGLQDGDVVRMINVVGADQLGGIDFTIGNLNANVHFDLAYMAAIAATGVGAPIGSFRKVNYDPIYYPRTRYISAITQAAAAVITLTVTHGYTVGQQIRVTVPAAYGMVEANTLVGTITAVDLVNNTITTDIDSTAFTAFTFPLTGVGAFSPAVINPVGMSGNILYVNSLTDAVYNQSYMGMHLAGGVDGPAGVANDVIRWIAGKSFRVINE